MKSFGELIPSILARCETMASFQDMLRECPTNSDRKNLIMEARQFGLLSDGETELLIQAHMLETD